MRTKTVELKLDPTCEQTETLHAYAGKAITSFELHHQSLILPQAGEIPFRGPDTLPPDIHDVALTHMGGRWYAKLSVPVRVRPLPPTGEKVGVDVGVYHLIATSKGVTVRPNPDIVRIDKLIRKQMAQRDHKTTESTRYRELTRRVERNTKRLYDIQLDQADYIASKLVEHNDFIAVEGVMVEGAGIQNNPLYKEASERASWQLLIDQIELRAYETGRTFVLVPPWWTSQTCSRCDRWVRKQLEERVHTCPHCGYRTDRDQNAAEVILKRGLLIHQGIKRFDGNWFPLGHPKHR